MFQKPNNVEVRHFRGARFCHSLEGEGHPNKVTLMRGGATRFSQILIIKKTEIDQIR